MAHDPSDEALASVARRASVTRRFDRTDAWVLLVVVVVGVVWRANALDVGPLSDDYIQHGMVHGLVPGTYAPWDLYALFSGDPAARAGQLELGLVPWWTAPDFRGEVLRPLPSLLLWLDHTLAPRSPVVHHVHSLLWWGLLLAVTGRLLRRLFDRPIAWTALVVFACDPGAALPVAWLANRAVLVSATLGFVAIWLHLRWREDGARGGPWVPLAGMTLAFFTGEYGLVAAGYVIAYELLVGDATASWPARLGPCLLPAALYLAWHVAGGYGMVGVEFYAHPFEDPGGYLRWLWLRGPRLLGALVAPLPGSTAVLADRVTIDPAWFSLSGPMATVHAHLVVAWIAIAIAGALAWGLRETWTAPERRTLRWLVVAAALGVVPVAVAPSHARLLLVSQLGASAFVAALIAGGVRALRAEPIWRRVLGGAAVALLAWSHGPSDAWFARRQIDAAADLARRAAGAIGSAGDVGGRHVVVLSSSAQTIMLHGTLVADYYGWPRPASWHVLSATPAPLDVRRLDVRTLELWHLGDRTWLDTMSARVFRPPPRTLATGETVDAGPLHLTVTADRDGRPLRVVARFDAALDDPSVAIFSLRGMQLRPFAVPPVGGVGIAPVPGDR